MSPVSAFRYFAALGLHAPYALVVLGLIVASGIWATVLDPREVDSGLGMVLFAQMFLASTGFLARARRGHFDPVLIGASDRTTVLLWHWFVSAGPGMAGWVCLIVAGSLLGSPVSASVLATRAASLFIVSALAWAGGFALARGAAGVVWMAALLGLLLRHTELLASPAIPLSAAIVVRNSSAILFCPFLLVGGHPVVPSVVVALAVLGAAVVVIGVLRFAGRLDVGLVERA